ncbi:Ferrichrome receptor FcuA [compost metagenome]
MVFRRPHPQRPTRTAGRASSSIVVCDAAPTFKANVLVVAIGCALASLVSVAVLAPSLALAAEPASSAASQEYAIPAGRLSDVLAQFAATSGVALSFDPQMLAGLRSSGLQGRYSVHEGFDRLLAGSGYQLVSTGSGGYSLHQVRTEGGAMTLVPVTVSGTAISSLNELPPAYAGGQVATGGRLGILGNRDFMETPFNQTSYTAELMENQQTRHIADVLGNDPTAHANGSTSTGADDFSIRGFYVGNTDLLFNGMPGVAPSFFNSMMAESIERVEVLKGPNALLNGVSPNGSVGGAINMIPKRASDEPLTRFTTSYAADSLFGGHLDVGRRFGEQQQFGIRFNGVHREGDSAIDHQSRRSTLVAFGLDYQGERLRLSSDLAYQEQAFKGITDFTSVAAGVPLPRAPSKHVNYDGPYEFSHPKVLYGTLRGEYDLSNHWTAFAAVGGSERGTQYISTNRRITDAQGTLAASSVNLAADKMYSRALEGGLQGRFTTGVVDHQMIVAYTTFDREWRRIRVPDSSGYPLSNIYNPVFGPGPDKSLLPDPDDARKMGELGLSGMTLADTLSIFDERLQLTLGARLQEIDSTSFNQTGGITARYKEDKLTPMVGIVVKPWQYVSLYANYIEGLQAGSVAPDTAANAGEVFAPYVTEQYEVGTKVDFDGLGASLSLYQITQPSAFIDPGTNIFGVHGEQRHRGLDFNVFGDVGSGIRLLGGAAYIDSRLTKTQGGVNEGNRGAAVPEWRFVLGAEWDTPFIQGLTLTGRATRNGSMWLDQANIQKVPAWTRLDIGARYSIKRSDEKAVVLRANLENALNKIHWDANSYGQLTLSDPRALSLSATFDF